MKTIYTGVELVLRRCSGHNAVESIWQRANNEAEVVKSHGDGHEVSAKRQCDKLHDIAN